MRSVISRVVNTVRSALSGETSDFDHKGRLTGYDVVGHKTVKSDIVDLLTEEMITHPTYGQIHTASQTIAEAVQNRMKLDDLTVVGVARGGLLPAVIISHALNVPLKVAHYSSKDGNGDDKNHSNSIPYITTNDVLVVDDIFDSGNTINEMYLEYTRRNHNTLTAVLYYKENVNLRMPDFYWHHLQSDAPWIIFPYEDV